MDVVGNMTSDMARFYIRGEEALTNWGLRCTMRLVANQPQRRCLHNKPYRAHKSPLRYPIIRVSLRQSRITGRKLKRIIPLLSETSVASRGKGVRGRAPTGASVATLTDPAPINATSPSAPLRRLSHPSSLELPVVSVRQLACDDSTVAFVYSL